MAQNDKDIRKPDVQSKEIPNKPAVQPKGQPFENKPGVAPPPKGR